VLPGRFPIHDLPDIGVDLPDGDYATVAGLVLELLGRIPTPGDEARIEGWQLHVRAMRGRAVTEIAPRPRAHGVHDPHLIGDIAENTAARPADERRPSDQGRRRRLQRHPRRGGTRLAARGYSDTVAVTHGWLNKPL
jgi:hypothetical protein